MALAFAMDRAASIPLESSPGEWPPLHAWEVKERSRGLLSIRPTTFPSIPTSVSETTPSGYTSSPSLLLAPASSSIYWCRPLPPRCDSPRSGLSCSPALPPNPMTTLVSLMPCDTA